MIGDRLAKVWNQQVITLNQPGAGGGISAKFASQQPNDGYTLYMPSTSTFLALPGAPGVAPNLPVELPRDFAPISYILEQPLYIGASHKSGINTIADVIRMAKEKPGEVTYAATGRGRLTHLTMELLQSRTGTKIQLVPYAGGPAQAMNDVMSGRVPLVLDGYAGLAPAIKGDLIKGLAATSLKRLPGFENLPTVAETVPDFFVGAWTILLAPVGTPPAIIRKIHDDMKIALDDPEMQAEARAQRRLRAPHGAGRGRGLRAERAEDLAADHGAGGEGSDEVAQYFPDLILRSGSRRVSKDGTISLAAHPSRRIAWRCSSG